MNHITFLVVKINWNRRSRTGVDLAATEPYFESFETRFAGAGPRRRST